MAACFWIYLAVGIRSSIFSGMAGWPFLNDRLAWLAANGRCGITPLIQIKRGAPGCASAGNSGPLALDQEPPRKEGMHQGPKFVVQHPPNGKEVAFDRVT
jgi:hypothetical protein